MLSVVFKNSLLEYYESTEEYEKCKYVANFFQNLEKEILLNSVVKSVEIHNMVFHPLKRRKRCMGRAYLLRQKEIEETIWLYQQSFRSSHASL